MIVKNLSQIDKKKVEMEGAEKAFKQMPISSIDGTPFYSFRVFTVEPGGFTPYHQHNYEHVNYIIDGDGFIINEKGEQTQVKKGDFALVNPNEKHQYRNASPDKDFVMICAVPKEFE
ncbi:MAG: cupin domain-containing protein [Melioribacteraceae bacterium]|nr:cupin domain-containing protein [Melioribacteraceae bacterium]MCF8355027.1 cupin domain-containing protein [Melioribacteraceae bacterium]MCF8392706.1 cupin domain-containing protein [Melioribacteraceae bacterium]MCF8417728.1 cupin domain-containing protein [Melioribacteraceae bacterium]